MKSYILYPNLTNEELEVATGNLPADEIAAIVGPNYKTFPVNLECYVPSGTPGKFTIDEDDEDAEELNQSDYVIIAGSEKLGEENAVAMILASENEIYGTAILALKEHL
jgi:hypothetical protein